MQKAFLIGKIFNARKRKAISQYISSKLFQPYFGRLKGSSFMVAVTFKFDSVVAFFLSCSVFLKSKYNELEESI